MSTTYLLYTEAKIDGVWRCIDGYIPYKFHRDEQEKYHLMTLYENGSRSYFGDTYTEMRSIGTSVLFSELSQEVQEEHPNLMYEDNFWHTDRDKDEKVEARYTVVPMNTLENHVPKSHEYHGVYHKNMISAFESGEIEYLSEDDDLDLKSLTEEEAKCYKYYEWDSPMGWYKFFKYISDIFRWTVEKYERYTFIEVEDARIVVFAL